MLQQELDEKLPFPRAFTKFFRFVLGGLIAILREIAAIFTKKKLLQNERLATAFFVRADLI